MAIIILEFFLFSFAGWIIDSADRTIETGKLTNAGFFRGPICPIYGVGGLLLMFFLKTFSGLNEYLLIFSATLAMVLVEYAGGIYCEKVLQIKLWDYSSSRLNIGGYIDLKHSVYWLILVSIFYYLFFPKLLIAEGFVNIPKFWDLPLLLSVILFFGWLTIRKIPARFVEIKDQILNLSVEEYQHLAADIRKFYRAKSHEMKKMLEEKINKRLEKSGGKLKKRG